MPIEEYLEAPKHYHVMWKMKTGMQGPGEWDPQDLAQDDGGGHGQEEVRRHSRDAQKGNPVRVK
jgi:hypothetical protein